MPKFPLKSVRYPVGVEFSISSLDSNNLSFLVSDRFMNSIIGCSRDQDTAGFGIGFKASHGVNHRTNDGVVPVVNTPEIAVGAGPGRDPHSYFYVHFACLGLHLLCHLNTAQSILLNPAGLWGAEEDHDSIAFKFVECSAVLACNLRHGVGYPFSQVVSSVGSIDFENGVKPAMSEKKTVRSLVWDSIVAC